MLIFNHPWELIGFGSFLYFLLHSKQGISLWNGLAYARNWKGEDRLVGNPRLARLRASPSLEIATLYDTEKWAAAIEIVDRLND